MLHHKIKKIKKIHTDKLDFVYCKEINRTDNMKIHSA